MEKQFIERRMCGSAYICFLKRCQRVRDADDPRHYGRGYSIPHLPAPNLKCKRRGLSLLLDLRRRGTRAFNFKTHAGGGGGFD